MAGVFARLGMGMTPLALLFLVHQETGQYALAAVTSGAYALSAALASPVVGRHATSGGQSLAGILLAVWGLGSVIGGFGYGTLRIAAPLSRQFGWLLAAVAVSTALLAVMPGPLALGAALAIGGIMIAPALTVYTAIVGRIVPAGMRNEANTWLATVPFAGNSAGGAVAGLIVDHSGAVPWSFGFAATVVAAAVLVAAWPSGPIKRADSAAVFAGELRPAALSSADHQ